jgi:hypothetical protein
MATLIIPLSRAPTPRRRQPKERRSGDRSINKWTGIFLMGFNAQIGTYSVITQ